MADRARVGKHLVGHYPTPTRRSEDQVRRASTVPIPSSGPLKPNLETTFSAPVADLSGSNLPSRFTPVSPRAPTPESPEEPTHPEVDLESSCEVPIKKQHWWQRGRKAGKERRQHSEATSRAHKKSPYELLKTILCSSWANLLLVFIPVGIALHFVNVSPTLVFVMNFLAIIPLAGVSSLSPFPPLSGVGILRLC